MRNNTIIVSIIIPVYNKEKYIERCLNSVINQTYDHIECIIVDDTSTDNSIEKAHKITDNYKGNLSFTYIIHKKNKGVSAARNSGTKAAKGDYLFYLDADDEIAPDCISKLVNEVYKKPLVDIVQGNTESIPSNNNYELSRYGFPNYYDSNYAIRLRFYDVRKRFPINVWNKLIRTDFIINNNLFFYEGVIHEDELWTAKMVKYCESMTFIYDYTYYRYYVPNSIMTSTNHIKSGYNWGIILCDLADHFDEVYFFYEYKRYLRDLTLWFYRAHSVKTIKKAHRSFTRIAMVHRMYYIAFVLYLSRLISFFPYGRRFGKHLTNLWIYK